MVSLALLALALFAGSAQSAFRGAGRIPATIEDYPYLVQVDFRSVASGVWGQSCAGTILTSYYVLSAARCFHGINYNPTNRRIRAGTTYRNTGGQLVRVERESNNPTYGLNGNDGDISVVKLLEPLEYSPEVAQGIFVAQGTVLPDNLPVVHAGWGATLQGGSESNELLKTVISTINHEKCKEVYWDLSIPEIVTDNMICAGYTGEESSDSCHGDFGGPLFYDDPAIGNICVGVVSWGYGCSDDTFPGVSTAVASYTDWIQNSVV